MYYFVSDKNFDMEILFPRIPENKAKPEDKVTPRICVSKSIIGCIESTGIFRKHETLYVHSCYSNNVYSPTQEQVDDVMFSGEEWIVEPVRMKLRWILDITKTNIHSNFCRWDFFESTGKFNFDLYGIESREDTY